jgi:hypothetical protein
VREEGEGAGAACQVPASAPPHRRRDRLWCHGAEQKSGRATVSGGGVNEEKDGEAGRVDKDRKGVGSVR